MQQHQRTFNRWKCLTHNTGSYNFNLINSHEFDACEIITDTTVGIVKPKTYGGFNGDISRNNYPDWVELAKFRQNQNLIFDTWNKFIQKKRVEISRYRRGKVADRAKGILQYNTKKRKVR